MRPLILSRFHFSACSSLLISLLSTEYFLWFVSLYFQTDRIAWIFRDFFSFRLFFFLSSFSSLFLRSSLQFPSSIALTDNENSISFSLLFFFQDCRGISLLHISFLRQFHWSSSISAFFSLFLSSSSSMPSQPAPGACHRVAAGVF